MNPQDKFDTVMLLLTETISSEEFLSYYNIYRPQPLTEKPWKALLRKVSNQHSKKHPTKVTAGIYPKKFSDNSVHYFGIRLDPNGDFTVGNGYPNAGGFGSKYGRALNAQPRDSHGLCQTFALMYNRKFEHLLKPGKYQTNVIIALKWLQDYFTQTYPWILRYETNNVQRSTNGPATNLRTLMGPQPYTVSDGVKFITLTNLVTWLLAPSRRHLLRAWADDLGPDL